MTDRRDKAIFERFIHNIDNIRETWQVVEFFETELARFRDEMGNYESDISKEQNNLKDIRAEYLELQDAIKTARNELESLKERKEQFAETAPDSIDKLRENLPLTPLEKVPIRLKDGIVVPANPANDVYGKEIAEMYLKSLWEMKSLKARLLDSDLENAKLRNEIRTMQDKANKAHKGV